MLAPETAAEAKHQAVESLGARVLKVPFDEWWKALATRSVPGVAGTFVASRHALSNDLLRGAPLARACERLESPGAFLRILADAPPTARAA